MTGKFFQLKEGQEEGIYTGLGDIRHGRTYQVYGEEQHALVKEDPRFKFVPAPAEASTVTPDSTVEKAAEADTSKPARRGKGSEE